jgi:hypothetical protein
MNLHIRIGRNGRAGLAYELDGDGKHWSDGGRDGYCVFGMNSIIFPLSLIHRWPFEKSEGGWGLMKWKCQFLLRLSSEY